MYTETVHIQMPVTRAIQLREVLREYGELIENVYADYIETGEGIDDLGEFAGRRAAARETYTKLAAVIGDESGVVKGVLNEAASA